MRGVQEAKSKQSAQKVLAAEVTELVHGRESTDYSCPFSYADELLVSSLRPIIAEAVRKALLATEILYHTDPSLLTASTVLDALEGDPRLCQTTWDEIRGVPITKLAVTFGLCRSRSKILRRRNGK